MAADAAGMSTSFAEVAARLTALAETIAAARASELTLERRDPAARWRRASLLWPRFTKG